MMVEKFLSCFWFDLIMFSYTTNEVGQEVGQ